MSKMKMNFLGLHTYPYNVSGTDVRGTNEPTVWVGTADKLTADGGVTAAGSYPTAYCNTGRPQWTYTPLATSAYSGGSAALFETDCWAPFPTTPGSCPFPATPQEQTSFFERVAAMLNSSFYHATAVGVETALGTETPLSYPGQNSAGDKGAQAQYEGVFTRLMKKLPSLDWYGTARHLHLLYYALTQTHRGYCLLPTTTATAIATSHCCIFSHADEENKTKRKKKNAYI